MSFLVITSDLSLEEGKKGLSYFLETFSSISFLDLSWLSDRKKYNHDFITDILEVEKIEALSLFIQEQRKNESLYFTTGIGKYPSIIETMSLGAIKPFIPVSQKLSDEFVLKLNVFFGGVDFIKFAPIKDDVYVDNHLLLLIIKKMYSLYFKHDYVVNDFKMIKLLSEISNSNTYINHDLDFDDLNNIFEYFIK